MEIKLSKSKSISIVKINIFTPRLLHGQEIYSNRSLWRAQIRHDALSGQTRVGKTKAVAWTTWTKLCFVHVVFGLLKMENWIRQLVQKGIRLAFKGASEAGSMTMGSTAHFEAGKGVQVNKSQTRSDVAGHTWLSHGPSCWKSRPASVNRWQTI